MFTALPDIRISTSISLIFACITLVACGESTDGSLQSGDAVQVAGALGGIDLNTESLAGVDESTSDSMTNALNSNHEYADQSVPAYIQKDNTGTNVISDEGAKLGRVLFYDKKLSADDTVSCASCHQQSLGFSDSETASIGINGTTARHSMRLVNTRFADEGKFFWDERADSLEAQVTQPIRDHVEMGFSGSDNAPGFADLILRLSDTDYYPGLFTQAFGNSVITEERVQNALAQFVRSIQSFDSRYDQGLALVQDPGAAFPNFTDEENEGKRLFTARGTFDQATGHRLADSGLGCNGCHRAPEFDIDPNSGNNGVISVIANVMLTDLTNTRSPSLRDLFDPSGSANGPFMHDGSLTSFNDVLDHYDDITFDPVENPDLDPRLRGTGAPNVNTRAQGQKLLLTDTEKRAVTSFIKTLSGQRLYTDPKWSDPFDNSGRLNLTD